VDQEAEIIPPSSKERNREKMIVDFPPHEVQQRGPLGGSSRHSDGGPGHVQARQRAQVGDNFPTVLLDHLSSIHSNLNVLDSNHCSQATSLVRKIDVLNNNNESHVTTIIKKIDEQKIGIMKGINVLYDQLYLKHDLTSE
jgi:hypothetical protein